MVEQLTEEQKKIAQEAVNTSEKSFQQKTLERAQEIQKEVQDQLDKAQQVLAAAPEKIIDKLQKAIEKLMNFVNGYENPEKKEFDADKVVEQLTALLNPVVETLKGLPVPAIPGLDKLGELLKMLADTKPEEKKEEDEEEDNGKLPEFPGYLKDLLMDLLSAIMSLCISLPMIFITLIFKIFEVIVKMFEMVQNAIGVPTIPYPLSIASDVVKVIPKVMDLILNLPSKLNDIIQHKLRQFYKNIRDCQIPKIPDKISVPKALPSVPEAATESGSLPKPSIDTSSAEDIIAQGQAAYGRI